MSFAMADPMEAPLTPELRSKCWECLQNKPLDDMKSETLCRQCDNNRDNRKRKLQQRQAVGRAIRKVAQKIGNDVLAIEKPHELYLEVLERLGGMKQFARLVVEDFLDAREADPKPRKVVLDYSKMIVALGIEAQKTAPPPMSTSLMSDDELTAEAERLAQEELRMMLDEEQKLIGNGVEGEESELEEAAI